MWSSALGRPRTNDRTSILALLPAVSFGSVRPRRTLSGSCPIVRNSDARMRATISSREMAVVKARPAGSGDRKEGHQTPAHCEAVAQEGEAWGDRDLFRSCGPGRRFVGRFERLDRPAHCPGDQIEISQQLDAVTDLRPFLRRQDRAKYAARIGKCDDPHVAGIGNVVGGQISFCRIRMEPFSSYALLSISFLAASRISARFFETDCIGSDADARNLFSRTSIEILHSTRFSPT